MSRIALVDDDRNILTSVSMTLEAEGFEEVRLNVVQPRQQRRELVAEGCARPRAVFSFSGSELSRARGGGRCLTMPIERDLLEG